MKRNKKIYISIVVLIVSSIILVGFSFNKTFFNTSPVVKPQEPSKPYPYYSEEVVFQNTQSNLALKGTLTMPSKGGNYPAVILISGSGPQNRNYEINGHKPFLILANHLTKNGIAVLRFDDRGFNESPKIFNESSITDFATDVSSALNYLRTRREINNEKIGLIGHSEGGIVAPMVASTSDNVSFVVLLGAPGINGNKIIINQSELYSKILGVSEPDIQNYIKQWEKIIQMITASDKKDTLKADLVKFLIKNYDEVPSALIPKNISKELYVEMLSNRLSSQSFKDLLTYKPLLILSKVTCPVLALNGEKDLQVTPYENLTGIKNSLLKGKNRNVTTKQIPNLNHFFQESKTGLPKEYEKIEQTFSPVALNEISDWILEKVK